MPALSRLEALVFRVAVTTSEKEEVQRRIEIDVAKLAAPYPVTVKDGLLPVTAICDFDNPAGLAAFIAVYDRVGSTIHCFPLHLAWDDFANVARMVKVLCQHEVDQGRTDYIFFSLRNFSAANRTRLKNVVPDAVGTGTRYSVKPSDVLARMGSVIP